MQGASDITHPHRLERGFLGMRIVQSGIGVNGLLPCGRLTQ